MEELEKRCFNTASPVTTRGPAVSSDGPALPAPYLALAPESCGGVSAGSTLALSLFHSKKNLLAFGPAISLIWRLGRVECQNSKGLSETLESNLAPRFNAVEAEAQTGEAT